jgi:predicted MPP superfamily phosphohydrolase
VTTYAGAEAPAVATQTFGTDPTPMQVHLGLVGDAKTSIVAQWRTKDEATRATTIRIGVGSHLAVPALTDVRTGITFAYRSTGAEVYRMHQAHLCGLAAGTTYSYQVGSIDLAGAEHFSPVYTFHTAPDVVAHPDAQVVFAFVGDSRGGYDVWQQLVDQIAQRTPDLVLFSGDAVTVGITQLEWEDFFTRAEPLFATVPVIAANGNHEYNAINYYAQMALPGDQQNFGVDYGFAHVTVGNDTPDDPMALTGTFHDAIAADFAASDSARWKLFMHHQPIFSASTKHGSSLTLAQAWQPLIDAHHIDLVLNGHDHDFEITKPMIGMAVQNGAAAANATVYVVAGGAGAELYPNGTQFWTAYSESTYSAAIINISHAQLTLDAFHPDGTPISNGSFSKSRP